MHMPSISDYEIQRIIMLIVVTSITLAFSRIAAYKMGTDSKPGEDPTLDRFKSKWYEAFFK